MIQCRAKMIDGSPVTFEWTDQGIFYDGYGSPFTVQEAVGHGFHVRTDHNWSEPAGERREKMRHALERSGVDTATVWRLEKGAWSSRFSRPVEGTDNTYWVDDRWVPLFPPVLKKMPASCAPGEITYIDAEPTAEMMEAGMAEGMACWARSIGNRETIRRVWCAMEKARR